ncbi:MAG: AI-2E family transporter, partial [Rhodothermales bacterium]|nr:AI-2E family transporter [Rhodothermales bacterium]
MRIRTVENAAFLLIVTLVTLAFLWVVRGFLQPVFWAAVLAILFGPVYLRLQRGVGRAWIASVLTILLVVVVVFLPLIGVGAAVTNEAVGLYEAVASGEIDLAETANAADQYLPQLEALLARFDVDLVEVRERASATAVTVSRFAAEQALGIGQSALRIIVLFILTLYLLFFFLRDGQRIIEALIRALPLGDARERMLFSRFAEVSRATIKGTLVVGVVQGTLGGLAFWVLGLPAAVLWGVVMTVLSLLPAVGSFIVWGPAAIYLLATGEIVKGVALIGAGAVIIGTIDNVLRPILVGRDTQLPDYLILLSTLGGLAVYGLSGFVIGPIIAGLFVTVWEMFTEEFAGADDATVAAVEEAAVRPGMEGAPPPEALPDHDAAAEAEPVE